MTTDLRPALTPEIEMKIAILTETGAETGIREITDLPAETVDSLEIKKNTTRRIIQSSINPEAEITLASRIDLVTEEINLVTEIILKTEATPEGETTLVVEIPEQETQETITILEIEIVTDREISLEVEIPTGEITRDLAHFPETETALSVSETKETGVTTPEREEATLTTDLNLVAEISRDTSQERDLDSSLETNLEIGMIEATLEEETNLEKSEKLTLQ
jgi:hypothetical protein